MLYRLIICERCDMRTYPSMKEVGKCERKIDRKPCNGKLYEILIEPPEGIGAKI